MKYIFIIILYLYIFENPAHTVKEFTRERVSELVLTFFQADHDVDISNETLDMLIKGVGKYPHQISKTNFFTPCTIPSNSTCA